MSNDICRVILPRIGIWLAGVQFIAAQGMAKVEVTDVTVLDNPSPFANPFQFEITFDCSENLPEG